MFRKQYSFRFVIRCKIQFGMIYGYPNYFMLLFTYLYMLHVLLDISEALFSCQPFLRIMSVKLFPTNLTVLLFLTFPIRIDCECFSMNID